MNRIFTLGLTLFCSVLAAQVGSLDQSFGNNGSTFVDYNSALNEGFAMHVLSNGKILVAGRTEASVSTDAIIARLLPNGNVDSSFGNNGKVVVDLAANDNFKAIAVQPDGKILAGGYYITNEGHYFVVRLDSNGVFDPSFALGGVDSLPNYDGLLYSMDLQSDGKILLGGSLFGAGNTRSMIVRLNANGGLDTSFDNDGVAEYQLTTSEAVIYDMKVQSDGKILGGGFHWNVNTANLMLLRVNSDGALDTTFSNDGFALLNTTSSYANGIALQSDGKIVVAGKGYINDIDFLLARFNTNGTLDSTFAESGVMVKSIGTMEDEARDIVVDADGNIIIAGTTRLPSTYEAFFIARFNSNGIPDSSFDGTGITVLSPYPNSGAQCWSVAVQSDYKILAAGTGWSGVGIDFTVVRLIGKCLAIDNTTAVSGNVISANQLGANYQWFVCSDSFSMVPNSNTRDFYPTESGNYGVIIEYGGCTDTSACINFTYVPSSITDIDLERLKIYPNPAGSYVIVSYINWTEGANIELYNTMGQLVKKTVVKDDKTLLLLDDLVEGCYLVKYINEAQDGAVVSVKPVFIAK